MQGTVKHHSICIRHKERLAPPPRVEGDDLEHLDRKLAVTEELKNTIPKILKTTSYMACPRRSINRVMY